MDDFPNFIYGGYNYPKHFPKPFHLHYYDLRYSMNFMIFYLHSNKFISHKFRHLEINCFLPKLLESYDISRDQGFPK